MSNERGSLHSPVWAAFCFSHESGFVSYYMPLHLKNNALDDNRLIANVINVDVNSSDTEVQFLITELNNIYDSFSRQYEQKRKDNMTHE